MDPCYLALGDTEMDRQHHYRTWVSTGMPTDELRLIRQAVQRGQLTGSDRFISEIEARIGRRVGAGGRGRPPKK